MFSDGFRRIHPADNLPTSVTIKAATAEKLVLSSSTSEGLRVDGVVISSADGNEFVIAKERTFLCCGAIETPILLIKVFTRAYAHN